LVAQISMVLAALILTIFQAFAKIGDNAICQSLAIASVWLWMIPVILGWVWVGTQRSYKSTTEEFGSSYIRS